MLRVQANFEEDLCSMADRDLKSRGIPRWAWKRARPPKRRDVLRQLLTLEHRSIPRQRRRTVWSDVLKDRSSDEWLNEARRIAAVSEAGGTLDHYQSKRIARALPDAQLNDWGITHLHLGGCQPGQEFSRQLDELLFVMVTPEELYLVDIGTHASFASLHLFETVHRNWPQLVAHGLLPRGAPEALTDAQRGVLRNKNANATTTTLDGTVYLVPGSGSVASGIPSSITVKVDWMVEQAQFLQRLCEQNVDGLADAAAKLNATFPDPVELTLIEFSSRLVVHVPAASVWIWAPVGSPDLKMSRRPPPE
jgi:hypothetical protein